MVSAGADVLVAGSLVALNLALAALVSQARPAALPARLAAVLFLANAGSAAMMVLPEPLPNQSVEFAFDALAFVPLLMLPLVFPRRRLSPRGTWLALAGTAAAVGWMVLATPLFAFDTYGTALPRDLRELAFVPFTALYAAVPAAGALLLLDTYLGATSSIMREQARFFLAAYAMKVFALALRVPTDGGVAPIPGWGAATVDAIRSAGDLALLVVAVAVPLALAASRLRRAAPRRAWGEDAFVLGFAAVGAALVLLPGDYRSVLEYLLLRPVLLAYGMLRFQLLDVTGAAPRAVLGAVVLAACSALFVTAAEAATAAGAGVLPAVGAGLALGLATAAVLAAPTLRLAGLGPGGPDRRLLLYRAALEAAAQEGRGDAAFEALRPLRQELGVSDREHAVLAAAGPDRGGDGALRPGTLFLSRYRVERELGRGASGEVYLARDERLGRQVALKRLAEHLRRDAAALERFRRETRLASALQHPHVVAVHDVETVGRDAYLVMEYVAGGSLEARLARGPLAEAEAVAVARDVLAALGALHARGIVHRDVKPGNVLLDEQGRAKLGDFTVAREAVSGETVGLAGPRGPVGTFAYMAPEQARGAPADPRSDVYGAGALVYRALAGRPPLEVDGLDEHAARLRIAQDAPALPLPGVSGRTNSALARALAKDPAARFPSAAAMAAALTG